MRNRLLSLAILLLAGCTAHDEQYYRTNPKILNETLKNCPATQPKDISCAQLSAIAMDVNKLGYQLQMNPQAFGRQILQLQQNLALLQEQQQQNPQQTDINVKIIQIKQQLTEHLAIVKWLESPEG